MNRSVSWLIVRVWSPKAWPLVFALLAIGLGLALGLAMVSPQATAVASVTFVVFFLFISARDPLSGLLIWIVTQPLLDAYANISLGASIPDLSPTRICIAFLTSLMLLRSAIGLFKLASFTWTDGVALLFIYGLSLSALAVTEGWRSLQVSFDQQIAAVLVYFLAKNLVRSRNDIGKVLAALVILGAFVGAYAIYEQTTGHVLLPVATHGRVVYGDSGLRILRGLLGHPHHFGRILGVALPVTFYLFFKERRLAMRVLYMLILAVMMIGMYLTFRRTAWIAALTSFFLIQLFYPQFRRWFLVLVTVTSVALYFNWDAFEDSAVSTRVQSGDTATLNGRTEGWDYAIELWGRQPITGHGYGQFTRIARAEGRRDTAVESQYFNILVSTGLVGFVPYIALLVLLPLSFIPLFRQTHDLSARWMAVVYWGAHVNFIVNAYTGDVNHVLPTAVLLVLAGALTRLTFPSATAA